MRSKIYIFLFSTATAWCVGRLGYPISHTLCSREFTDEERMNVTEHHTKLCWIILPSNCQATPNRSGQQQNGTNNKRNAICDETKSPKGIGVHFISLEMKLTLFVAINCRLCRTLTTLENAILLFCFFRVFAPLSRTHALTGSRFAFIFSFLFSNFTLKAVSDWR